MKEGVAEWRFERHLLAPIMDARCESEDLRIEPFIVKHAVRMIDIIEENFQGKIYCDEIPKTTKKLCVSFAIKFQSNYDLQKFIEAIPSILKSL